MHNQTIIIIVLNNFVNFPQNREKRVRGFGDGKKKLNRLNGR